jgi:hydrogenase-4 membrane subunit HyfE
MLKRYPVIFGLFNVGFLILIITLSNTIEALPLNKLTWSIYVLFVITTLLMHLFLTTGANEKANAFVRKFMLATTLKLLLYLAIIVFFFLFNKMMAKTFIIWFLLHYTCFTVFETLMLYSSTKK